ncbi:hypothetical protein GOV07_01800 [Candidatus Woesearchaeota archaeon]|nr:hypothetical protein [Candidatus Woesearchaeota archaeon]
MIESFHTTILCSNEELEKVAELLNGRLTDNPQHIGFRYEAMSPSPIDFFWFETRVLAQNLFRSQNHLKIGKGGQAIIDEGSGDAHARCTGITVSPTCLKESIMRYHVPHERYIVIAPGDTFSVFVGLDVTRNSPFYGHRTWRS